MFVEVCLDLAGPGKGPETLEQFGDCSLLPVGRGFNIVICPEQGTYRGEQLGAVCNMKGALFERVPKCHSQTACSRAQSLCHHGSLMLAMKSVWLSPVSHTVEAEEGMNMELLLVCG